MARAIDDTIGLRVCACTSLAVMATVLIMALTMIALEEYTIAAKIATLPDAVQRELDFLDLNDLENSPRAHQIYAQYFTHTPFGSARWSILVGLSICLPFGLLAGIWVSRYVSAPLSAIAHAARRISCADFSVRAKTSQRGGLATVVRDFNMMADALESLERDRKMTAAAISHELRTPLAVLQANLHALADGVIEATPQTYLRMVAQIEHLSRLINDVHTLSIVDAGKLHLQRDTLDLSALAADVLTQFRQRLDSVGIVGGLESTATHFVWADSGRMRQILGNLIENVVRHAHVGGKLKLSVWNQGTDVLLSVQDWGDGLPSSMQHHMFERFYRPDTSRTRSTGGSGLGLAIVKALISAQDGSVAVDSRIGEGCTITLRLPAYSAARIKNRPAANAVNDTKNEMLT